MFKPNIIVFLVMFLLVITFDISEARRGGGGRGGQRGGAAMHGGGQTQTRGIHISCNWPPSKLSVSVNKKISCRIFLARMEGWEWRSAPSYRRFKVDETLWHKNISNNFNDKDKSKEGAR